MNTQLSTLLAPLIGKKAAGTLLAKLEEIGNPSYLLKISSQEELSPYIGEKAAQKLIAALQLGRSLSITSDNWHKVCSPEVAYELLIPNVRPRQECAQAIYLDTSLQVLSVKILNVGLTSETLVDIKEMLRWAIALNASSIIFAHNHPSGDMRPSYEDMQLTKMLIKACDLVDIDLQDHLVLGDGKFASLKQICPNYWAD
jgi:DNA repair protein RadC